MFFQQALKPQELVRTLAFVSECCFVVRCFLPQKEYHVALYKYMEEYYLLKNSVIRDSISQIEEETGEEEDLLTLVEECLETNQYIIVNEELVFLDLNTLMQLAKESLIEIRFFEFDN